jgi:hypothetical protein
MRRREFSGAPSIRQTPERAFAGVETHRERVYLIRGLAILALFVVASFPAKGAARSDPSELFRIERSKNKNVVCYAGRVDERGELDVEHPVVAYWLMLAKDGKREELTWLEQQLAYGFSVERGRGGLALRLVAFGSRPIYLRRRGERIHAETTIGGRLAFLDSIWVQADDGLLGPQVRWIELRGSDPQSGAKRVERIAHR